MSDTLKKQFTRLYTDESDAVFRFCFLRTSDRDVAIDIMQDTFMRFWEVYARQEEVIESKRAFLFAIARNRIIDWYRKKKSPSLDALVEKAGAEGETFKDTTQVENIEMAAEAKSLIEKIGELDPLYQQVVYLRYVEDLEPREIAEILGETANVISVRLHRGLKQLRAVAGYDEEKHGT
ncbi:MAG: RNA polymerase sigma factor [Candidatus Pacebacteria bacterium]|nr:RNA polymerase sigma factor [Candidatus Paceibacterota bacterium]